MQHLHRARARRVVAIQAAHQRALAAAGVAGQSHALARGNLEIKTGKDADARAARVQGEVLGQAARTKQGCHGCSTEETSSCV
jgi:hypothetical protein